MLSPNQIKMQNFTTAGRGAYRASEVDSFLQKVYFSYTELISENSNLKKKFASLSTIIEEYNAGKNAIATALVKAQTVADQTVESANTAAEEILGDAKEKAQALMAEKIKQAEDYAKEKKQAADDYFAKSETELQRIFADAQAQSAKYAEEINAQAQKIIADANEKASKIVSAAFKDAKEYRQKADDIIAKAKVEVETTKNSVAFFKDNTMSVLAQILPLIEQIELDEFVEPELDAFEDEAATDSASGVPEAPKFELNNLFEEVEATQEEVEKVIEAAVQEQPEEVEAEEALIPDVDDYVDELFKGIDIPSVVNDDTMEIDLEEVAEEIVEEAVEEPTAQEEIKPDFEEIKPTAGGFKFHLTKDFDIFDD